MTFFNLHSTLLVYTLCRSHVDLLTPDWRLHKTHSHLSGFSFFQHTCKLKHMHARIQKTHLHRYCVKRTYSTEAGGSGRAGRSRQSRLAGHTISSSGASRTLQVGRQMKTITLLSTIWPQGQVSYCLK